MKTAPWVPLCSGNSGLCVGEPLTVRATLLNVPQGSVEATGVPTDVAIQGEGFFVVQKNRATDYTRAGNFAIDRNNFLATQVAHRLWDTQR